MSETMEAFEKELTSLINRHSIENVVDMPDFLLAGMICRIIEAMGPNIKKTLDWHGCNSVCHPSSKSSALPPQEFGKSTRNCFEPGTLYIVGGKIMKLGKEPDVEGADKPRKPFSEPPPNLNDPQWPQAFSVWAQCKAESLDMDAIEMMCRALGLNKEADKWRKKHKVPAVENPDPKGVQQNENKT